MRQHVCVCAYVCVYTYILRAYAVSRKSMKRANATKDLVIFWHNWIVYYYTGACTASVFHEKQKVKEVTQLTVWQFLAIHATFRIVNILLRACWRAVCCEENKSFSARIYWYVTNRWKRKSENNSASVYV